MLSAGQRLWFNPAKAQENKLDLLKEVNTELNLQK